MFYLIIILVSSLMIISGNTAALGFTWEKFVSVSLSVAVGVIAVISADGIGAIAIRRLTPSNWYHPKRCIFKISRCERNIYCSLRVKKWKNLVPELGMFTGFSKREVKSISDKKYLERFLTESNYGTVIHLENAFFGFVIMFIPCCSAPSVWLPIFVVNFILSIMPVAVLRYTSYTLLRLYKRLE